MVRSLVCVIELEFISMFYLGYNNIGEVWREELEMPSLKMNVEKLLNDVRPFYKILHAVLRNALREKYHGEEDIKPDGPIPAHLLGNFLFYVLAKHMLYSGSLVFPGTP